MQSRTASTPIHIAYRSEADLPPVGGNGSGSGGNRPPVHVSFLHNRDYDNLEPKGKLKDYNEGGSAVKFETFHDAKYKLKSVKFL